MHVYAIRSIRHSPCFPVAPSPGDRILMSPLEDDTVFFGALAAGLRPVMAPVSTHDGNMRIDVIDDADMVTISAVLTGNTYGLPDRVVELSATCADSRFRSSKMPPMHSKRTLTDAPSGASALFPPSACRSISPAGEAFSRSVRKSAAMTSLDCAISPCCQGRSATERPASRDRRPGSSSRPSVSCGESIMHAA